MMKYNKKTGVLTMQTHNMEHIAGDMVDEKTTLIDGIKAELYLDGLDIDPKKIKKIVINMED